MSHTGLPAAARAEFSRSRARCDSAAASEAKHDGSHPGEKNSHHSCKGMAHGTPVITSNVSSLPVVVGNAAVLVNPENVFDIMRALHRVLTDKVLRDRMKQRGYQQAKRFSWEISVRRVLDVYREIAAAKGSSREVESRQTA